MKTIQCSFIVLFLLKLTPVYAESWYQVEIIIFDRLNPDLSEESWNNEKPKIRPDMTELYPNFQTSIDQEFVPYMIMDEKNNRMNGVYRVLKLSRDYRPLVHFSWQQPATKRHESRYIHIFKNNAGKESSEIEKQESIIEPNFIEDFISNEKILDGSIRIRSDFYLHVDLNLYYFKNLFVDGEIYEKKTQSLDENFERLIIGLKESRKIKLNEIHYFDNPMYGVILQVSRLGES